MNTWFLNFEVRCLKENEDTTREDGVMIQDKNYCVFKLLIMWILYCGCFYYWYKVAYRFALRPEGKRLKGYVVSENICCL